MLLQNPKSIIMGQGHSRCMNMHICVWEIRDFKEMFVPGMGRWFILFPLRKPVSSEQFKKIPQKKKRIEYSFFPYNANNLSLCHTAMEMV